ncbi:MAG: hypothetical protein M9951_16890 [Burkholderiaceae bacterium]|nr:hypothetical protein [Burkholderiaceae bacterium]
MQERDVAELGARLGANIEFVARGTDSPLGRSDYGRYIPRGYQNGRPRSDIFVDKNLSRDDIRRTQAHEVSHLLDDRTVGDLLEGGSRIPIDGIKPTTPTSRPSGRGRFFITSARTSCSEQTAR